MDVIAAYREVGTYRGAAAICGTTHKTVSGSSRPTRLPARGRCRRSGSRAQLRRGRRAGRGEGRQDRRAGSPRSGCCRPRGRPAMRGRPATSGGWSPRRSGVATRAGHAPVAAVRRSGRRVRRWSSTGARSLGGPQVHVFCAVLAWSRFRFVRFAADEQQATTLAMLAECFEVLGGVPKVVLADRMGCLKGGVVANVVVPTPDYVRFATHYRFRPDFCHAADPESKGIVENLVGYAKDDLMVPLELDDDPWAGGLAGSTPAPQAWCAEVNAGDAFGDLRGPGRAAGHRGRAAGRVAVAAAASSVRSRSPARSTSSPASGSARPATRSRTGSIGTTVTVLVDDATGPAGDRAGHRRGPRRARAGRAG